MAFFDDLDVTTVVLEEQKNIIENWLSNSIPAQMYTGFHREGHNKRHIDDIKDGTYTFKFNRGVVITCTVLDLVRVGDHYELTPLNPNYPVGVLGWDNLTPPDLVTFTTTVTLVDLRIASKFSPTTFEKEKQYHTKVIHKELF